MRSIEFYFELFVDSLSLMDLCCSRGWTNTRFEFCPFTIITINLYYQKFPHISLDTVLKLNFRWILFKPSVFKNGCAHWDITIIAMHVRWLHVWPKSQNRASDFRQIRCQHYHILFWCAGIRKCACYGTAKSWEIIYVFAFEVLRPNLIWTWTYIQISSVKNLQIKTPN